MTGHPQEKQSKGNKAAYAHLTPLDAIDVHVHMAEYVKNYKHFFPHFLSTSMFSAFNYSTSEDVCCSDWDNDHMTHYRPTHKASL